MRSGALVTKWFRRELSGKQAERLFALLKTSAAVRGELERCLAIEAMLTGRGDGPSALSHFELERIEDFVVSTTLGHSQEGPLKALLRSLFPAEGPPRALMFFLPVLALAILLPIVLLLRAPTVERSDTGVIPASMFAPRGVKTPYETHLFLFCVEDGKGETAVRRLDRPSFMAEETDTCSVREELQFAVTNLSDDYPFIYVLGIDEAARRLWYFPKPRQGKSREIPTGIRESLLGDSILLHVNHRPGWARVFAVFSRRPIADDEIEGALKAIREQPNVLYLPLQRADIYMESFALQIIHQGDAR